MIKSIVDGFAFDLQRETYCYGGEALYQYQVCVWKQLNACADYYWVVNS
jgi:hypothetical protein